MATRIPIQEHVKCVRALMTPRVITITPDASLPSAARCMREHVIRCLPVLERGELVGILTARDLVVRGLAGVVEVALLCVREVMSVGVVSCSADQTVDEVGSLMTERGVSRLPVLARTGRLVGIVSWQDIAGPAARSKPHRVVFYRRLTCPIGARVPALDALSSAPGRIGGAA